MITLKQSFRWSPNGYEVVTVEAGNHDTLPERAIIVAKALGLVVEVSAAEDRQDSAAEKTSPGSEEHPSPQPKPTARKKKKGNHRNKVKA